MSALPGSPGIAGETGSHDWSKYGVRGGEEILPPERFGVGQSGWSWTRKSEATEPDLAGFDFAGRFGRSGAIPVRDGSLAPKPRRLPGPAQFVVKLLEFWRLEDRDAVRLLGFDKHDAHYVASVLAGGQQFRGRDVRERIGHLFRIRSILSALFRDRETENGWLRERHSLLHDRVPMDLMLGGSMEDLLLVRDYVERAAGW